MGAEVIIPSIISAGSQLIGRNNNRRAINSAERSNREANAQALNFARESRDQQRADFEPFRQYGIQQANALGEIFGFDPVGGGPSTPANRGVVHYGGRGGESPRGRARYIGGRGGSNGYRLEAIDAPQYGRVSIGGAGQPSNIPAAQTQQDRQEAAQERFQNSLFNDVFTQGFDREVDGIDAGLAGQGLAFSGARMNAVENARADNYLSALGLYTNTLLGSPSTAGAAGSANASANFGAQAGNLALNQGRNAAQSAYARANNSNSFLDGIANLGGNFFGGGGFGFGGKK